MGSYRFGFEDLDARLHKPRCLGMTEIRGPYYSVMGPRCIQDILETKGHFIDGLKFKGGSTSLMPRGFLKEIIGIAHQHAVYVSTGGWAEHVLAKGPSVFKQYVQDCKDLGFDILEWNTGFLNFPEEDLLRLIRIVKNEGLKAKPLLEVQIPDTENASFQQLQRDVNVLIKRAERCLEAGADMIMFDAEGITKDVGFCWRTDLIAKIIERLGLQRIMFEAEEPETLQWFVENYGSGINLFVDHSHAMRLECLRKGTFRCGTDYDYHRV